LTENVFKLISANSNSNLNSYPKPKAQKTFRKNEITSLFGKFPDSELSSHPDNKRKDKLKLFQLLLHEFLYRHITAIISINSNKMNLPFFNKVLVRYVYEGVLTVKLWPGIPLSVPSLLKRPIRGPKSAAPTKAAVPPRMCIGPDPAESIYLNSKNIKSSFGLGAHLFVKVPRPGDSEGIFAVFESSCHLLLLV